MKNTSRVPEAHIGSQTAQLCPDEALGSFGQLLPESSVVRGEHYRSLLSAPLQGLRLKAGLCGHSHYHFYTECKN